MRRLGIGLVVLLTGLAVACMGRSGAAGGDRSREDRPAPGGPSAARAPGGSPSYDRTDSLAAALDSLRAWSYRQRDLGLQLHTLHSTTDSFLLEGMRAMERRLRKLENPTVQPDSVGMSKTGVRL